MLSAVPSTNRSRKSRPSAAFCRERFACARVKALASYECEECGTEQCEDCERQLHEDRKYAAHSRRKIRQVSPERLCEAKPPCEPRNFADVVCVDCGNCRYCFDCDRKAHSVKSASPRASTVKLSSHRREPFCFPSPQTFPGSPASSVAGAVEPSGLLLSPVKTLSPLSAYDDSVTFFSLPQSETPSEVTDMCDRVEAIPKPSSTRTGQQKNKTLRSEKAERTSGEVELSHGSIPDVAAMLPISSDIELRNADLNDDNDNDDEIAESLHQSHLLDGPDSSAVQSFMLVDHNEELQVCLTFTSILTRDIDIANLSVRPSVCLSVTFRYQMKTASHIVIVFHQTVAQSF